LFSLFHYQAVQPLWPTSAKICAADLVSLKMSRVATQFPVSLPLHIIRFVTDFRQQSLSIATADTVFGKFKPIQICSQIVIS
jgi:hypothetical protein